MIEPLPLTITRAWAMPCRDTLSIKPIKELVDRHIDGVSVDPFSRNCGLCTFTNDLDPDTKAKHHLDAHDFILMLLKNGIRANTVIFDPPYSIRQVKEVYASVGKSFHKQDSQMAIRWPGLRDKINKLCLPGAKVITLGWNSTGMGLKRGFEKIELLLVNHGSAHNDTICLVEKKQ